MGVTIHFEGKLKSQDCFQEVIDIAKKFAITNDLAFTIFEEENKLLERIHNEQKWDYQGLTKGILILLDKSSDPLNLEFDKDLYIQEFCKTQFADLSVHIILVDLLRQIEQCFDTFIVEDEGEYWDTSDILLLEMHFDNCFKAIEDAKREDSTLRGPFRLNNGRIVDLMN